MPTSENAILYYEAAQTSVGQTLLTNALADRKTFKSAANFWSGRAGYLPVVRPNGLVTGGAITPAASETEEMIDVAALTCYLAGVLTSVDADADVTVNRPTGSATDYQKHSVTVTALGAIAVVEGAEGSSFSTTRGAAGGPPYIDNDAIEIGQVWYSSQSTAVVLASEIYQVPGNSLERYEYPNWSVVYAAVASGVLGYAGVTFVSALAGIHSEDAGTTVAGKLVYASYYTPTFAEAVDAFDFVPPANAHSVNSTQVYGRTKGSKSSTLNQGSFSIELQDGVTDGLLSVIDNNLWFKFYPNRLNSPYMVCQGSLGMNQSFPAGANISAACTITAEVKADRLFS